MLTISGTFAAVIASVPMLGTSQCPLDASDWLPTPSVACTTRFAPRAPRYVPAPSSLLITAVSAPFDTSRVSVQPVDASACPPDPSVWFPAPFASPARQLVPPRRIHSISPLSGLSDSIDVITSVLDSFWVSAMHNCWQHSTIGLSTLSRPLVPPSQPSNLFSMVSPASFDLLEPSACSTAAFDVFALPFESFVSPLAHTIHSPLSGSLCALGTFSHAFSLR